MNYDEFFKAVGDYRQSISAVIKRIENHYGTNLLDGRKRGIIPRSGKLGNLEFDFHGVGCRVIVDDTWIDWDFPPEGYEVGIDPWKLWSFTRSNPDKYPEFSDLTRIRQAVSELEAQGILKRMKQTNSYCVVDR